MSDSARISTSYVGRQNLTMRMVVRWSTRLINAVSTKVRGRASLLRPIFSAARTRQPQAATATGVADHVFSIRAIMEL